MKYLHTMVRVTDLDASLDFYCNKLGLEELRRRIDVEAGRFSLIFLAPARRSSDAQVELNLQLGSGEATAAVATSDTWPTPSTTSTPPASG